MDGDEAIDLVTAGPFKHKIIFEYKPVLVSLAAESPNRTAGMTTGGSLLPLAFIPKTERVYSTPDSSPRSIKSGSEPRTLNFGITWKSVLPSIELSVC